MNIHEYQAKEILRDHGIPVPPGEVARTPEEAEAIARRYGGMVVVKAQVHAGGRGKAGGVKLARTPEEAKEHGLLVDTAMFNHLVRGKERKGSKHSYVAPDAKADQHNSLTLPWWILEVLPKAARPGETRRWSVVGLHFPLGERRRIEPDDQIHRSVRLRQAGRPDYQPPNLPRGK